MLKIFNTKSWNIKTKQIALTMTATLLMGGSSIAIFSYLASQQKTEKLNTFKAYSKNLSDSIAAQFFERYGDIQAFAINPAVRSADKSTSVSMLNQLSSLYGIYDLILYVNTDGQLVSVNNKSPQGKDLDVSKLYKKDYSNEPWFKSVINGKFTEDTEKGFKETFVENFHNDEIVNTVYGGNNLGNSFSAAIKDPNRKNNWCDQQSSWI